MQYTGSCHCGQVQFEADLDIKQLISCNCSICSRKGSLLTFSDLEHFKLVKGEDNLQDYQFNTHTIHHLFCKTCGIGPFGRGKKPGGPEMVAINARCLENFDFSDVPVVHYDGKSL